MFLRWKAEDSEDEVYILSYVVYEVNHHRSAQQNKGPFRFTIYVCVALMPSNIRSVLIVAVILVVLVVVAVTVCV